MEIKLTIVEKVEYEREYISEVTGEFDILSNSDDQVLIKSEKGSFYIITWKPGHKSIDIENINWITNSILCKKRKKKYYNRTGFKKGEI